MAANVGGVSKRIIVFDNEGTYMTIFNPEIIKKSGPYGTEENFFLYSATLTNTSAIRSSKYNGKPANFQSEPKSLPVHRLFNTKLIIIKEF